MPETHSISPTQIIRLKSRGYEHYAKAQNATYGIANYNIAPSDQNNPFVGQGGHASYILAEYREIDRNYEINRAVYVFDLSDIPTERTISNAVLTLVTTGSQAWHEDDIFDLVIVPFTEVSDYSYSTAWHAFGSESLGSTEIYPFEGTDLITDWEFASEKEYQITLNATGLQLLMERYKQSKQFLIGLRSDRDIDGIGPKFRESPTTYPGVPPREARHWVYLTGADNCSLDLTIPEWPEHAFPDVPEFPETGYMDLPTYTVIKEYIEAFCETLPDMISDDNIFFPDYDGKIYWYDSDEEITRDGDNNIYNFTSLSSDSTITTCDAVTVNALTNTTLTTTGNASVAEDLTISNAAYASIKEQIEHDNLWWETTSDTPSVSAGTAKIYQEHDTGDLRITINSGGSTKTAILADFSGM